MNRRFMFVSYAKAYFLPERSVTYFFGQGAKYTPSIELAAFGRAFARHPMFSRAEAGSAKP
jgi:hypothetical protein